jgi:DoxX-like family
MVGAIITHTRRGETQPIAINVVLLLLAAFVTSGRFGNYSF